MEKKLKPINLLGNIDNVKNKLKIKELSITNNLSSSNIKKKRELLIPLKINKKKIIKNNDTLNEISNIEKPKNIKKFIYNAKQELSEADFQDFPFSSKKNDNNNDKKEKTTSKEESEDLNNPDNIDKNLKNNFQSVDLSNFIGIEKKIYFKSPKNKDYSNGKSIFNRRKSIFEKKK